MLSDDLYAMYLVDLHNLWWPHVICLLPLTLIETLAFIINILLAHFASFASFTAAVETGIWMAH